jgi:hypothetical protein
VDEVVGCQQEHHDHGNHDDDHASDENDGLRSLGAVRSDVLTSSQRIQRCFKGSRPIRGHDKPVGPCSVGRDHEHNTVRPIGQF